MSQYKYAEIGETVYFWFAANETTGAAGDGASPLYDVRLGGAASDAAPTASGTPTLLSHADYSNGLYEIAVDTTGYSAGEYAVFCTLTISEVNPTGFCGSVKVRAAGAAALPTNLTHILGTAPTEGGAGRLAAAFTKLLDVASPQLTSASKDQTGDSYAEVTHADYGLDKLVRSTTPGNTLSVDANHFVAVPETQDVNAKTVTNGAISNATFNADVGSTAYATNIIALAVRKVLDELKLDHLIAVAESDDPVDNSIIAKLAATGGDWSTFVGSTDSLQGIRDRGDAAWVTATGFAVAGDEMKLEDDAITAAKFDESTAFPLKAADTGATILARAGDEMDLVDAPNETAVTAIQNGLSTFDSTSDGVTLTTGGIDAIFDRNSSLSISFETLINRIYQMINDKMEVTNESGDVVLRNIADSADIATGNVTDNSTTTVRKGLTWV